MCKQVDYRIYQFMYFYPQNLILYMIFEKCFSFWGKSPDPLAFALLWTILNMPLAPTTACLLPHLLMINYTG